jgi:hypothetical protein
MRSAQYETLEELRLISEQYMAESDSLPSDDGYDYGLAAAKIKAKSVPVRRVAANAYPAPATERKKPGRKPKVVKAPTTDIPASTSADTNPAPRQVTRSKRTAENAGIDDSVAPMPTGSRKNPRLA